MGLKLKGTSRVGSRTERENPKYVERWTETGPTTLPLKVIKKKKSEIFIPFKSLVQKDCKITKGLVKNL